MTKNQFVAAIAAKTGKAKSESAEMVDAVFDTITQTMIKGDSVNISGFGVFRVSDRKAREGINPRTGEKIKIAAKKAPKFRAGKTLKEAVK
ncbi:MAG: HU family DNA-binding protein [Parcubacteria group bacterium]|nr:HU family DNA-binding protein [Parcubacteria group bacterium]